MKGAFGIEQSKSMTSKSRSTLMWNELERDGTINDHRACRAIKSKEISHIRINAGVEAERERPSPGHQIDPEGPTI